MNPTDLEAVSDIEMHQHADRGGPLPTAARDRRLCFAGRRRSGRPGQARGQDHRDTKLPENVRVTMRGSVEGMRQSFKSFGIGLLSRSCWFT